MAQFQRFQTPIGLEAKEPASTHARAPGWQAWLFLLPAVVFSAVVYYPIIGNYFFADDFLNLYQIENRPVLEYLFTPNAGHRLIARNAFFYLHSQLFGTNPEPYYWAVLATHLVNVWLLFRVIRRLTNNLPLASFGAVLWGTCPLHEGTLGWYSVYGHVLVGTTTLLILDSVLRSRRSDTELTRRREGLWFVLALIGANCFSSGLAVAMVLPFAVWLLVPKWPSGPRRRRSLVSLIVVVPLLYFGELRVYEAISGRSIEAVGPLVQLFTNWKSNALVFLQLAGFGATHLFFRVPLPPWMIPGAWYLFFAALVGVLLAAFFTGRPDERRALGAFVLLLFACYAITAVGRGTFLAQFGPQLLTRSSRYHYVGLALLSVSVCLMLDRLRAVRGKYARMLLVGAYACLLACAAIDGPEIDHHLDARHGTETVLASIHSRVDRARAGQTVRIRNFNFLPLPLQRTMFPGWAAVFSIFFPENALDGHRVVFVEKNPDVLERTKNDRRVGSLLVPP